MRSIAASVADSNSLKSNAIPPEAARLIRFFTWQRGGFYFATIHAGSVRAGERPGASFYGQLQSDSEAEMFLK